MESQPIGSVNSLKKFCIIVSDVINKIVQIILPDGQIGTGFIIKTNIGKGERIYLCTTEHILSKDNIDYLTKITLKTENKSFEINLKYKDLDIKIFSKPINIIYIEIKEKISYLLQDPNYMNEDDNYEYLIGEKVLLFNNSKIDNCLYALTNIEKVEKNDIYFKANIDKNFIGSPIILTNSGKVIGINKGIIKENLITATLLKDIGKNKTFKNNEINPEKQIKIKIENNNNNTINNSESSDSPNKSEKKNNKEKVDKLGDKIEWLKKKNKINQEKSDKKEKILKNSSNKSEHIKNYTGDVQNKVPHGKGKMVYKDDSYYVGDWVNGKREGYGYFKGSDELEYRGEWKDDKQNGQGIQFSNNGDKYEGYFKDGLKDGFGVLTFENNEKYEGNFSNDKRNGKGKYFYANGDDYDGDWKNDKPDGYGTFSFSNGAIYEGHFKNNKYEGKGKMLFKDGSEYEGDWKNDIISGKGIMHYNDGNEYEGFWKNNERNGFGKMKYKNGSVYEGEWKNNKRDGKGVFHDKDGNEYISLWKNDIKISNIKNINSVNNDNSDFKKDDKEDNKNILHPITTKLQSEDEVFKNDDIYKMNLKISPNINKPDDSDTESNNNFFLGKKRENK